MKTRSIQRKRAPVVRTIHVAGRSNYNELSGGISALLDEARRQTVRSVNAILTATYWEIGRRIVEHVQQGEARAGYGDEVLERLSRDLTKKFGRGYSRPNLQQMKQFYQVNPVEKICQTLSDKFNRQGLNSFFQTVSAKFLLPEKCQTVSDKSPVPISAALSRKSEIDLALYLEALCQAFPLSWSHYVRLLSVEKPEARNFYEAESLRGGWSVRQLDRQISTLFYERTALSKNKAMLLVRGAEARPEDAVSIEEEIKSPYVLEFFEVWRGGIAESG